MENRDKRIYKVTLTGGIVNMLLLVFKFVAGVLGNSAAMAPTRCSVVRAC